MSTKDKYVQIENRSLDFVQVVLCQLEFASYFQVLAL